VLPDQGLVFLDNVIDSEPIISFVTEIELQTWNTVNPDDLNIYRQFISRCAIIGVDAAIIQETINIRRFFKLKLPDALIAATTIVNELVPIADNDKDFSRVSNLRYFNPRIGS
jgi:predicted nucleic acid-binding protein